MKKKKISIIVPVYNVEQYLTQCVESIISQNINDYEIILVDDGSIDNSGKICDELQKKYNIIEVIHKKNGGLSSARNAGIKKSVGEYLMFIDSDDFLYFDGQLNKIITNLNYDIIQYKMVYYYSNIDKYVFLNDIAYKDSLDYEKEIEKRVSDGSLSISACDKIIKKDLIVKNDLFFEEGQLSEDIDWSLKLYQYANSLKAVNNNLYVYRQQRAGSITTTAGEKNIKSLYNIIEKWYYYDYKNKNIKRIYYNYLAYQSLILLTNCNKKNITKELYNKIKKTSKELILYNSNYRVKFFCKIKKIIGFNNSIKLMKLYVLLKNKGVIKI